MRQRGLSLTVVGLPIREELLVKSLLQVVNARTRDRWFFSDELESDVALCNPRSPLSAHACKKAERTGSPRCISVLQDGEMPIVGTATLKSPIRAGDLIELLNTISAALFSETTYRAVLPLKSAVSAEVSNEPFCFGIELHALIRRASRGDVYRINASGLELHVIPAERAVLLTKPLSEEVLHGLFRSGDVQVSRLGDIELQTLIAGGAKPQSIDGLLWRAGLDGVHDQLLPTLPINAKYELRRWPDFGRLKHQPFHLRMAALLTSAPLSIDELTLASAQSPSHARAFVNACALCDLIQVRMEAEAVIAASPQKPFAPQPVLNSYAGIFRSIRHVLGFTQS